MNTQAFDASDRANRLETVSGVDESAVERRSALRVT